MTHPLNLVPFGTDTLQRSLQRHSDGEPPDLVIESRHETTGHLLSSLTGLLVRLCASQR